MMSGFPSHPSTWVCEHTKFTILNPSPVSSLNFAIPQQLVVMQDYDFVSKKPTQALEQPTLVKS